jgi:CHAD domain-containing protein
MRVAIRRLRSALGTFEDSFVPRQVRTLRRATRRIGRKLGEVRDADVHLAALRATLGGASENDRPGIAFAIDELLARRRTALAEFAIELSQFDRESLNRVLADG